MNQAELQDAVWRVSWVDRAQELLARVPLPWWVPILAIPAGLIGLEYLLLKIPIFRAPFDNVPTGLTIFYAAQPSYLIGLMYVLDRRAEEAVVPLQSHLTSDSNPQRLRFSISNMPRWPALILTLTGLALFLILHSLTNIVETIVLVGTPEPARWLRFMEGALVWMAGFVVFYHTIRQLRIIDQIYTGHVTVNLLDQKPLYGLATIAAYTAIGVAIPSFAVFVSLPRLPTDPITLALAISVFALPAFTLIAPLYRLHLKLESEKGSRLDVNSAKIDGLIRRIHSHEDPESLEDVDHIHKLVSLLGVEREIVSSARTWPWPSGSMRALFAALLLPTIVWFIQRILESVFP